MVNSHEMLTIIPRLTSAHLQVNPERCVHVRHRKAQCMRCAQVCTSGAISFSDEGLFVEAEHCIGCGTCASVCPSACLEALSPTDDTLIEHLVTQSGSTATISCQCAALETAHSARVACLGRIDESIMVEAVAHGISRLQLLSGPCEQCSHKQGDVICSQAITSAQDILNALGTHATIQRIKTDALANKITADYNAETTNTSVRADDNAWTEDPAYTHVQADGTLPHFVPEKRLRLFNSMKHLGKPTQDTLRTRLWGQVYIDTELCRSCRMCSVFCPTGALMRFDAEDGNFGIEHRCTICTQCRLCETICPENALHVSDTVSLQKFFTGEKTRFIMQTLEFKPGGADSISTRLARFVKTDAFQDPQGTLSTRDVAEGRAYAQARAARRQEIREAHRSKNAQSN